MSHHSESDQAVSAEEISLNLERLGVSEGDTVLVRCDIGSIGKMEGGSQLIFLKLLLEKIGETGTLVVPAFTESVWWNQELPAPFKRLTFSYAGTLANALIRHPDAIRSHHPTHSFIAVGADATFYMADHSPATACFFPLYKMMNKQAKMLLIGCVDSSPGFSTVHLAQFELGLSRKHLTRLLLKSSYIDSEGVVQIYRPIESPGCSLGFSKFYKDYVVAGLLKTAKIGKAYSLSMDMTEAFEIELDILEKNPKYALCENPSCLSCRVLNAYNLNQMPKALFLQIAKQLTNRLRSLNPK